jgi:hypothetical protein
MEQNEQIEVARSAQARLTLRIGLLSDAPAVESRYTKETP